MERLTFSRCANLSARGVNCMIVLIYLGFVMYGIYMLCYYLLFPPFETQNMTLEHQICDKGEYYASCRKICENKPWVIVCPPLCPNTTYMNETRCFQFITNATCNLLYDCESCSIFLFRNQEQACQSLQEYDSRYDNWSQKKYNVRFLAIFILTFWALCGLFILSTLVNVFSIILYWILKYENILNFIHRFNQITPFPNPPPSMVLLS